MADSDVSQVGALTSRDAAAIETTFYNSSPTRGFEDFLVTLPDEADFPFELQHTLTPSQPHGVRYEVLQATYPVTLYHNNNDIWEPGVVTLRATSGGGQQIRVRLTVDDGDADPLVEGDRTAVYAHFPHGLVVQRSEDIGSTISTDRGRISLHPGIYGLDDFGVGGSGPALVLDPNQAGVTDNAWGIQADTTWGSANPRLLFGSSRATDTGDWAMALLSDQLNTADVWYLIPGVGATFNLGGDTSELGNPYRFNNLKLKGSIYERSRTTALGEWTNVAHSAGNFTGGGAQTWTVASGDQSTFAYMLVGKTMFLKLQVVTSSIGGTPNPALRIAIPGGFTTAKAFTGMALAIKNSAVSTTHELILTNCGASSSTIDLYLLGAVNWPATTNTTSVYVDAVFEVN